VLHLAEHPEVHARLLEDDAFMRTATEEYLRLATPVLSIGRVAKEPASVGGQTIAAGEPVLLCWAAANRDPAIFDDPDDVQLERWPNRHLAFGVGPHRCIGSNLGRAMFRVMTRRLLTRMPDFRVVAAEPEEDRSVHAGFRRLEIEFTPGPKVLPDATPAPQFQAAYEQAQP
jgi:cytochrome P450